MKIFKIFLIIIEMIIFAIGALIIGGIIFPIYSLILKKEKQRKVFANIIHKAWAFFVWIMESTRIVHVSKNLLRKYWIKVIIL